MQALQEGGLSRAGLLSCPKRGGGAWLSSPSTHGSRSRNLGALTRVFHGTGSRDQSPELGLELAPGHLTMGYLLRSTRSTWDDPLTCRPGSPRRPGTASKHVLGCPPPHAAHAPKTPWCQAHRQGLDGLGAMRFRGPGSYCSFAVMCVKLRLVFSSLWWQSV